MRISDWSSDVCSSDLDQYEGQRSDRDREIEGSWRDETLIGGGGDDEIEGKGGDDLLIGGGDDDELDGDDGDDTLVGGSGDDELEGDTGDDVLYGDGTATTGDRKSTRLNSSHSCASRMPSSACKKKTT